MKITKYEHACLVVEEDSQSLVIDPGAYTKDFSAPDNVVGVVITHEHADHLSKDLLKEIFDKNPDAVVVAHEDVIKQLNGLNKKPAVPNESMKVGNFDLEFFGGKHAVIVESWPGLANLGVLVNGRLYYPGDSFSVPEGHDVEVLALPVAAPWLKFNEVIDFLTAIKPKLAFPTHDAILSDAGKGLPDGMIPGVAESFGTKYQRIDKTPLEI